MRIFLLLFFSASLVYGQNELKGTSIQLGPSTGSGGVRVTQSNGTITFTGNGNGTDENLTINLNTANAAVLSSSTGLATIDFSAIGLTTTGAVNAGSIGATTPGSGAFTTLSASGPLSFSGTTNSGLRLNNLTTTQRDALTPLAGMSIFNTTTAQAETYNGAAWAGPGVIVTKVTAGSYTVGTTDPRELYGGVIYVTSTGTITVPAVAAGASFTVITIGAIAVHVDPNASDLIYLDGTALADGDKITNASTAGDIAVFTYFDGTGWYAATNGWTDTN